MLSAYHLRELLNAQRYCLLVLTLGIEELNVDIINQNLKSIWEVTSIISEATGIDLESREEIVKHGKEIVELHKLFNLD